LSAKIHFVVTCEHGGNRIPRRYQQLFGRYHHLLHSHRGYDAGALQLAREAADMLHAEFFAATVSRLLIDLNRSIGHRKLYSEATRPAPATVRSEILECYYLPYRNRVEMSISRAIQGGQSVVHISSHSFTPELNGEVRNADIGLLYDPSRSLERDICSRLRASLIATDPALMVRRNYPYFGKANGFPTSLRRQFPPDAYVAIELEINQKHVLKGGRQWRLLRSAVLKSLAEAVAENHIMQDARGKAIECHSSS
jgi:predicted N-formylglutamate amidohydrolase